MNLIRKKDDGTISLGQNSIDMDNTNDVISSSGGILTLGDHDNHLTRVRGILSAQDNATVDGTLGVTGATTLNDDLTVAGTTALDNTTVNGWLSVRDNATFQDTLTATGLATLNGGADVNGNLDVRDNTTLTGTLGVTGATTITNDLTVTGTTTLNATSIAGVLSVRDNATIGDSLDVGGSTALSGTLNVTGLSTLSSVVITDNATIQGNLNVTGSILSNQLSSTDGNSMVRRETDGSIHLGTNSMVFYDSTSAQGAGWDVMTSSVGKIQIGNSPSDVTTFIGSVNVPDPVGPDNAANKRYVDRIATSSAAMAAVLDTKRPAEGTNSNVSISTAGSDVSSAIGVNYSGALFANSQEMDKSFPIDFSLGIASSNSLTMGKASFGISW